MMKEDSHYYHDHQDEIVKGHLGEIVVIKDSLVKGYYKTWEDAFAASKAYPLGSFMVTDCEPTGADVVKLHNRLIRFVEA
jgi:hypothetical protein